MSAGCAFEVCLNCFFVSFLFFIFLADKRQVPLLLEVTGMGEMELPF